MESVSTRLDDETARLIRETANEKGVSMAEVLRELIEKGMDYSGVGASAHGEAPPKRPPLHPNSDGSAPPKAPPTDSDTQSGR